MRKIRRLIFYTLLKLLLLLIVFSASWVIMYRFLNPPVTPLMVIRYFEVGDNTKKFHKQWADYNQISNNMKLALIAAEDQNFLEHKGFDVNSIKTAIMHNFKGKKTRGASTISQQVVKNVFLWPSRTWFRKGLETYFTILVELFWTKKRILEVYMNVIEVGNGIYGVEAASRLLFKKPSKNLTKEDAALIAAVLPSPHKMSPLKPSPYVQKRKRWILQQMNNLNNLNSMLDG